eukprot:NODE_705_length_4989_cov_0.075460.p1 type:complete len:604 gc:universal NODE_705_length_4989_cov_0.075460:624-2435(+)
MSTKGNVADKAKMFAERSKLDTIYCDKCSKHVLKNAPDHIVFEGVVYHLENFKCSICKAHLKSSNAVKYKNELYCQTHNPLKDHNRLSLDTESKHRHRSDSSTEEYVAIRVKKEHKILQLPQNWMGTSIGKSSLDLRSNNNFSGEDKSSKEVAEEKSIRVPALIANVEYEDIKNSFEKMDLENRKKPSDRGRSRSTSATSKDEEPLRRRLHTESQGLKFKVSMVAERAEMVQDFFDESPDFWFEIDHSNCKPKTNKPPILIMGDEVSHHFEFGRESIRNFTNLGISPYNKYDMEWVDVPCLYYRYFMKDMDHTNYIARTEEGPVLISIYMDKGENSSDEEASFTDIAGMMDVLKDNKYRILMRWKGGLDWRIVFYESEFRNKTSVKSRINRRKILSYLHPSLTPNKLIRIQAPEIKDEICKFDEIRITTEYKFGMIMVKSGQVKEEEIFANNEGSSDYYEFLGIIGDKIELLGFEGYCGGLDSKNTRTGINSVHTKFSDFEIMFHVSSYLPFDPADTQQIQRKRHIGNDIVCLVFLEEGAKFDPTMIASRFLHVYICVQKLKTGWKVVVAANKHIPYFGPPLPSPNIFTDPKTLKDYLLTKRT